MNKNDLIEKIAAQTDYPKSQIESILNQSIHVIKKAVHKGDDVTIVGFGTFTRTNRKARAGFNPRTGQKMQIPAMTLPKFKPGKEFKELLS